MWTTLRAAAILTALTLVVAVAPVRAQKVTREPIKPIREIAGAATYKAYCTVCHGTSGRGDGPAAKALTTRPADLTTIARRHGGKFPVSEVKDAITADIEVPAHGTREMPMWGPVFRSVDDRSVTELRIANLVTYIEGLQQK
jgi:mono/diheme cytochrome c family protein